MPAIPGTAGDDILYGTDDPDTITGLAGNDRLFGFGGDDTLDGGDGNDNLDGGAGADSMTGGANNDFYVVDDLGDLVTELAGGGSDLVYTYITYTLPAEVERLAIYSRSSTFAVNLTGNTLANELIGNDGANFFDGGDGADILQGAGGDDQYLVTAGDSVRENQGGGFDIVWVPSTLSSWSIRPTLVSQTNWIDGLGAYDPASTNAMQLLGNVHDNSLWGNNGNNSLDGDVGVDTMEGFGGDDFYFIDNINDSVTETAGNGFDTIWMARNFGNAPLSSTFATFTLPANVERFIGRAITVFGNAEDNEIRSSTDGGGGTIDGGAGADLMYGGAGPTTFYVDNVGDQVIDANGANVIFTSVSYVLPDIGIVRMTALGTDAINLTGNVGATELVGNDGANVIDGRAGADSMAGNGGDDIYFVDNLGDTVTESAGEGYDTIYTAAVTLTLSANVERGGAVDRASTVAFNLTGNAGDNELWGDDGANVIDGKEGIDVLQGGGGADQYLFSTPFTGPSSADQLVDFLSGTDSIALDDAIFQAFAPGSVAAGSFIIGTEAQDADDYLMYDPTTGFLYYDGDANGSYRPSGQIATLHEGALLAATDFVIV